MVHHDQVRDQAQPQTVFDWKFWEKAARDPKMTAYLNHGVKAKMCETTPFVKIAWDRSMLLQELKLNGACEL